MNVVRHADAGTTVFALASGIGRSAIAVIRISGPHCRQVVSSLCDLPPPRRAYLRVLRSRAGDALDRGLVLWFPAPASYTGEDSAELQLHGGQAVVDGVIAALMDGGARPAEPGEFTRRAFLSGKIDLLEAEAVADLVDAETSEQRTQALRQLGGEQSRLLSDWASRLLRCVALQEALIDFSEEELPDVETEMLEHLRTLQDELGRHGETARRGERLRRGLVFTIVGPPNVGKSSLLNVLARRNASIVSAQPGTTRDLVAVEIILAGVPVTLIDTAGIRQATDDVEAEGIRRARVQAEQSDMIIEICEASASESVVAHPHRLAVANKIDLAPPPPGVLGVSVQTGEGLDQLWSELELSARRLAGVGGSASFNRARHQAALQEARSAIGAAQDNPNSEMRAEDLRIAMQALGKITGQADTEDVLDLVFGSFCIGK